MHNTKQVVHSPAAPLRVATGWRLAVAGGLAGMLTNTILHPLDTIKTVRQTNPAKFHGMLPTLVSVVRQRGPLSLYTGLPPALIGSALSSALYFSFYELCRSLLSVRLPRSFTRARERVPLTALSAACGNVVSSVLFVPKEVVKQRMQSGVDAAPFLTATRNIVQQTGLGGLYRGYKATLLRNIPSTMIRFAVYEELKLILRATSARSNVQADGDCMNTSPLNPRYVAAGSLAGAISSIATTPLDVVKTRFATGKIPPGTEILPALADIVRTDGLPGLFVGLRPRTIWSALFAAIGFTSYELCKSWIVGARWPPRKELTRATSFRGGHLVTTTAPRRDARRMIEAVR